MRGGRVRERVSSLAVAVAVVAPTSAPRSTHISISISISIPSHPIAHPIPISSVPFNRPPPTCYVVTGVLFLWPRVQPFPRSLISALHLLRVLTFQYNNSIQLNSIFNSVISTPIFFVLSFPHVTTFLTCTSYANLPGSLFFLFFSFLNISNCSSLLARNKLGVVRKPSAHRTSPELSYQPASSHLHIYLPIYRSVYTYLPYRLTPHIIGGGVQRKGGEEIT